LQNVAVHNTTVHYVATTGNQKLEYLSFWLALIKSLTETYQPAVPQPVYGCPSTEPAQKWLTEWNTSEKICASVKKGQTKKLCVVCGKQ
jgi:hypothetical protein